MDTKLRLLVVGDGGVKTGFARVLESIINHLPEEDYDVHHLAINYTGDPYPHKAFHHMYPARLGGDLIGLNRIGDMVKKLRPDVIFMLNDLWLLRMYLEKLDDETLAKTVVYFPIDGEYSDPEWLTRFDLLGARFAYTEFAVKELKKIMPSLPVGTIPHGVDTEVFYPIEREDARKVLNIPPEKHKFIVLNANRNQPRKRIDLTIQAFAEFAKDKPDDVALYLHMGIKDAGWHIPKMAHRYGIDKRIILTSMALTPANFVPDHIMNAIYNSAEIGINTAMGEGWGLPSVEHAVTGAAQIVPNCSATAEIFADCGKLIDIADSYTYPEMLTVGKVISVKHAAELLNELYESPSLLEQVSKAGYEKLTRPEYQWKNIARAWDLVFKQVANANNMAGDTGT